MPKKVSNTKSKIINAAWDLFYDQGYDNTTVDEIIEKSGTSKGSFYHYFSSKDSLLSTLSYMFDEKYRELEPNLTDEQTCLEKLMYLNKELFRMIENKIDINLLAGLLSTQVVTRDREADILAEEIIVEPSIVPARLPLFTRTEARVL